MRRLWPAGAAALAAHVGVLALLETGAFVGLVAPGETTVLVGGVVAGQGEIDLLLLIGIVWTSAVAGDFTSYVLGRRLGREFLVRHGPRLKITEARLHQVEEFFARHGGATILIGRVRRARPRDRPVPRGRIEAAAADVPPLRRARRGPPGGALLPARLPLLALARRGDGVREPGAGRVRGSPSPSSWAVSTRGASLGRRRSAHGGGRGSSSAGAVGWCCGRRAARASSSTA